MTHNACMHHHHIESLRSWFESESRDFPWRLAPVPYAVWVSEVMLQQTRASVVVPYFERWMKKFPTIAALAQASQDEVVKEWEGLGYYSRARNLHEGARYVMSHFNGALPDNAEGLQEIKGLGPYTIGAILSFAFHQRVAAVDGNVLRVLARYYHVDEDISKPKVVKGIQALAQALLPEQRAWVISEALIELGATICGKSPQCTLCPLKEGCQAHLRGDAQTLPIKSKKYPTTLLKRGVGMIMCAGALLVRQCLPGEIMAGLWEFPYIEVPYAEHVQGHILQGYFEQKWGVKLQWVHALKEVPQAFTRYKVTLCTHVFLTEERIDVAGYQWVPIEGFEKMALSSGHRRILNASLHKLPLSH